MREFTKEEKRQIKAVIRIGILRRHAEWLNQLKELLNQPFSDNENEFDRSMAITDKSRKFYKEAMKMEDYYRNSVLHFSILNLFFDGYITWDDLSQLSEELQDFFQALIDLYENH